MRILLVDDDELLTQTLAAYLTSQHYAVDVAMDGETGWDYTQVASYDLIVLDINLPKLDGVRLCQKLRQNRYTSPILLLTAKGNSSDKVMGLDAGADDYLVKPCTTEELSARIRALLRRQSAAATLQLEWGDLCLDPVSCEVTYQGQVLTLSPKEYGLLELFLRNPQRVFSSSIILERLWGFDDAPGEETIRTHIKRLRRKLKLVGAEDLIDTVYGMGYRLKPLAESASPTAADATPDSPADQARAAAIALWEQFKAPILERMATLDRAVTALQAGNLTDELRQSATTDAHKLVGSLGMFALQEGSRLASEIEQQLQVVNETGSAAQLQALIAALRRELERSPQAPDEEASPPAASGSVDVTRILAESRAARQGRAQGSDVSEGRSLDVKVLVVDDDSLILATLQQFLPQWGIQPITLNSPLQLWEVLERETPDLLILDVDMPQINGIDLCRVIRNHSIWNGLPILFLTAHRDLETILQLYAAGADDYVAKPFTEPEIVTRVFNRLERNRLLRNLAEIDVLTGVANRHRSTQEFERYLSLSRRYDQPFCLVVLDLDGFRRINDQYGHELGDTVLKQIGGLLQRSLRSEDVVARWGGEEFVVGMYGIRKQQSQRRFAQIQQRLHHEVLLSDVADPLRLTFSAGIAEAPGDSTDLRSLYQVASIALSQAKAAGCDRIMTA